MDIKEALGLLSLLVSLGALLISNKEIIKKKMRVIDLGDSVNAAIEQNMKVVMALSMANKLITVNRFYALISTVSALAFKANVGRDTLFFVFLALLAYEAFLLLLKRLLDTDIDGIHIGNYKNTYRVVNGSIYLKLFSAVLLALPLLFYWIVRVIVQ